jgi:hypothetical protein
MDIVTVEIKIKQDLTAAEKTELIKSGLNSIITQLDTTGGDMEKAKAEDETSIIEYNHLKNQ